MAVGVAVFVSACVCVTGTADAMPAIADIWSSFWEKYQGETPAKVKMVC